MTIEQTLDEVEKHWDSDRTEATRAIMRYAEAQKSDLREQIEGIDYSGEALASNETRRGFDAMRAEVLALLEVNSLDK